MPSLRTRFMVGVSRLLIKGRITPFDLAKLRRRTSLVGRWVRIPRDVRIEEVNAGGVAAEMVRAAGVCEDRVLVHVHGGGFVLGQAAEMRRITSTLSAVAGMTVLSVDYRLAPEEKFPAAVEDVVSAYRWLLDECRFSGSSIGFAGESAGGNLVLAALPLLRELGLPVPRCVAVVSPLTDMTLTSPSFVENADLSADWTLKDVQYFLDLYLLPGQDRRDPRASPLFADLRDLPPALIMASDIEVLRDDSVRFAERYEQAGNEVVLELWPGLPHGFPMGIGKIPEAMQGMNRIGSWIAEQME